MQASRRMSTMHATIQLSGMPRRVLTMLALVLVMFAVQSVAKADNPWILISSSASNPAAPAPNWSPPDQGVGSYPKPALGDLKAASFT